MYEKRIFRTDKSADCPFTRVDNRLLIDDSLSFGARGLMSYLISKPNNWVLIKENLINSSPAGSTVVNRLLNELEKAGYIESKSERTSAGKFATKIFIIYEYKSLNKSEEDEVKLDLPMNDIRDGKSTMDKPHKVNLRLVTNDFNNERKKTTTPISKLIWPNMVTEQHKQSILKIAGDLDSEIIQKFLYEMESTTITVRNPVAYFNGLWSKLKRDEYVPSGAISQTDKRESKKRAEDAYEAMLEESRKAGDVFLAKYLKQNM